MDIKSKKIHKHITSFQVISLGFVGIILFGTLMLMLPFSTVDGEGASFGDSLFTATSAVCVTGLVVRDTATYWSFFGQAVILSLIQIGGIGVITVGMAIAIATGRKIGLMQRSTMQEAISAHQVGGIVRLTKFILKISVCIELIGAAAMSLVFCRDFGFLKGLWYSVFHSVSAFCNAGFDLMGVREEFSSLTTYACSPIINITIMSLIVIGGIGFITWSDIQKNKWHWQKYHMQSKVIITTTAVLILLPTLYFFFFEFSDLPLCERIWSSAFQAVTPRTAGFNTADLTLLSETGLTLIIVLMLIGGSPGSTAGGMKTTTAAVLFSSAISVFRKEDSSHMYGRRFADEAIKSAATVMLMYITLFLSGGMIISYIEDIPMLTALFETSSAIGTVGLSLGATTTLSGISKAILVILMFFGRVGGLTLIFATGFEKRSTNSRLPQEKITVG